MTSSWPIPPNTFTMIWTPEDCKLPILESTFLPIQGSGFMPIIPSSLLEGPVKLTQLRESPTLPPLTFIISWKSTDLKGFISQIPIVRIPRAVYLLYRGFMWWKVSLETWECSSVTKKILRPFMLPNLQHAPFSNPPKGLSGEWCSSTTHTSSTISKAFSRFFSLEYFSPHLDSLNDPHSWIFRTYVRTLSQRQSSRYRTQWRQLPQFYQNQWRS